MDGFILWDRETESLWWPLIDKAVSDKLKAVKLKKLEDAFWEDSTWEKVKANYAAAQILISGQNFERPTTWTTIGDVSQIVKTYSN